MSTSGRPSAVSWWLSRGRPTNKNEKINLHDFPQKMRTWWKAMQPACRIVEGSDWPLSRDVPDNTDWSSMRKGGKNGLVLYVVALYWWQKEARAQDNEAIEEELHLLMEDLLFVLHNLDGGQEPDSTNGLGVVATEGRHEPQTTEAVRDEDPALTTTRSNAKKRPATSNLTTKKPKRTKTSAKQASGAFDVGEKRVTRSQATRA